MFDAQIAVALFAAFLLGMIAGSGVEIIVRGGRHSDSRFDREVRGHAAGADRYWSACRRALGPSEERTPGRWIY